MPMTIEQQNWLILAQNALTNALKSKGVSLRLLPTMLQQVLHEAGGFKFASKASDLAKTDNNLSGIMFINKPKQKNAVRGSQMPLKDTGGKVAYYANFLTVQDWANDYIRILSEYKSKPLEATDEADFAKRLKDSGYYGATYESYLAALKSWAATVKKYAQKINFSDGSIQATLFILGLIFIIYGFSK